MAYCSKCGAYIPDGMTRCLACGYDDHAEQTAAQYAYKYDEAQAKKDYEAERQRKQQASRKWAQEEYERRQKQQAEDAEKARKAREEAARQAAEKARREREEAERKAAESYDSTRQSDAGLSYTEGNSRIFASLSYIPFLFLLQKMFLPDDAFAEYHAKQGKKLTFVWIIASILSSIFGMGWLTFILGCGYVARGMANAREGKMVELPFINKLFNLFKK